MVGRIGAAGGHAAYAVCDVTREADCKRLIDTAVDTFGGVDVLICNAGISMRALFDEVDLAVLHKLMDVNFWGCVNCTKYALPYIQRVHGSIVGVSSVAGIHGLPGRTGYSASKYAMTGFLETIRIENRKKGVHVMIACPGFTASNVRFSALTADGSQQGETPREEGKMMTAEEVARIIARAVVRAQALVPDGISGTCHAFRQEILAVAARQALLLVYVQGARFAFQVAHCPLRPAVIVRLQPAAVAAGHCFCSG